MFVMGKYAVKIQRRLKLRALLQWSLIVIGFGGLATAWLHKAAVTIPTPKPDRRGSMTGDRPISSRLPAWHDDHEIDTTIVLPIQDQKYAASKAEAPQDTATPVLPPVPPRIIERYSTDRIGWNLEEMDRLAVLDTLTVLTVGQCYQHVHSP